MVFSFVVYLITFSEKIARSFFVMISTLQLMMHIPLFNIRFPANVISTIEIFFPLLGFDILSLVVDWEKTPLDFDFDGYDAYAEDHINLQI